MCIQKNETVLLDLHPPADSFSEAVVQGLRQADKTLPCEYLYDERGSQLFDEICEQEEYYVTRAELEIMRRYSAEMASQIGPEVMLVEFGSGSSIKTQLLLDELTRPVAYVPVDISREHLRRTADRLAARYQQMEVLPVCADFTTRFHLPEASRRPSHVAVYFPGSTIGNFTKIAAREVLSSIARLCGPGGGLLIGIDLQKDVAVLEAAYNDAAGVTAEFSRNLLKRINRELDASIQVERFEHEAVYNQKAGRIEISLVSQCAQDAAVEGHVFHFAAGERIRTEYSHKYTVEGFAELAGESGFGLHRHWTDEQNRFAVLHLVNEQNASNEPRSAMNLPERSGSFRKN